MTDEEFQKAKRRLKKKIDEMSTAKFEIITKSEDSFMDWIEGVLAKIGIYIAKASKYFISLWAWFTGLFD